MQHELPDIAHEEQFISINRNTAGYLVGNLRQHGNYTLGVLLTAVEASLGDSKQAQALKAIVRREMFMHIDRNQAEVYQLSGEQKHGLAPKELHIDGQDAQIHVYPQDN